MAHDVNEAELYVVYKWLYDVVKLPKYFQLFNEHGYDDMDTMMGITDEELQQIGIDKIGEYVNYGVVFTTMWSPIQLCGRNLYDSIVNVLGGSYDYLS